MRRNDDHGMGRRWCILLRGVCWWAVWRRRVLGCHLRLESRQLLGLTVAIVVLRTLLLLESVWLLLRHVAALPIEVFWGLVVGIAIVHCPAVATEAIEAAWSVCD